MTEYDRFLDLQKQGFMRMAHGEYKPRRVAAPKPVMACAACLDWHRQGAHVRPIAERREIMAARKAGTLLDWIEARS